MIAWHITEELKTSGSCFPDTTLFLACQHPQYLQHFYPFFIFFSFIFSPFQLSRNSPFSFNFFMPPVKTQRTKTIKPMRSKATYLLESTWSQIGHAASLLRIFLASSVPIFDCYWKLYRFEFHQFLH